MNRYDIYMYIYNIYIYMNMMMMLMMMMMMNRWTLATFPNMFRENQFWGEPDIQFKQKSYTVLLVDAGPIVEVLCGQRMSTMPLCWSLKKCAAVIPTLQVLWDSKSNTLSTSSNVEEFPRTCSHPVGTSKFWTMYSYVFIYIYIYSIYLWAGVICLRKTTMVIGTVWN